MLLDSDLAELYKVETRVLNQAVHRNRERFPEDFMFQLTEGAAEALRSQTVISKEEGRGGRRYRPYAFTEQGVAMLSSVLRSKSAIEVNIAIMRTFVRLRQLLATYEDLARELEELRWRQEEQGQQIQAVFETIQHLIEAPVDEQRRPIGFPINSLKRRIENEKPRRTGYFRDCCSALITIGFRTMKPINSDLRSGCSSENCAVSFFSTLSQLSYVLSPVM